MSVTEDTARETGYLSIPCCDRVGRFLKKCSDLQGKGFSPVCVLLWSFRESFFFNTLTGRAGVLQNYYILDHIWYSSSR